MPNETGSGGGKSLNWIRRIWETLSKFVLLPLVGALIGAMLIGRVVQSFIGSDSYKVYVVGNFDTPDGAAATILRELQKGTLPTIGPDGVKVEVMRESDSGDPSGAEQKASELASRPDTLLVVGHFSSTQTKAALPSYLRTAQPPIPVILTTETNPNLLPPKAQSIAYDPVFRLSPTDDQQAIAAADFGISRGATGFWVVQDLSNPVYSDYLTRMFSERVLEKSTNVVVWGNSLSIPPVEAIRTLKINWIFYAGGWQGAIQLARQVRAIPGGDNIRILLSDASVSPKLLPAGGSIMEGVYLTYFMSADAYNNKDIGYGRYGSDAFQVIKQLIESANDHYVEIASEQGGLGYRIRRLLGLRRARDARNVVIAVMRDASSRQHTFAITNGESYRFRYETGVALDAKYHVWQVRGHKFLEPPGN